MRERERESHTNRIHFLDCDKTARQFSFSSIFFMFFFVVVVFIAILVLVHISLCLVGFPLQQQPSGPAPLATPPGHAPSLCLSHLPPSPPVQDLGLTPPPQPIQSCSFVCLFVFFMETASFFLRFYGFQKFNGKHAHTLLINVDGPTASFNAVDRQLFGYTHTHTHRHTHVSADLFSMDRLAGGWFHWLPFSADVYSCKYITPLT